MAKEGCCFDRSDRSITRRRSSSARANGGGRKGKGEQQQQSRKQLLLGLFLVVAVVAYCSVVVVGSPASSRDSSASADVLAHTIEQPTAATAAATIRSYKLYYGWQIEQKGAGATASAAVDTEDDADNSNIMDTTSTSSFVAAPIATCRQTAQEQRTAEDGADGTLHTFVFDAHQEGDSDDNTTNDISSERNGGNGNNDEGGATISVATTAMKYGKVGARLWPSAIALSLYLAGTGVARDKKTLELGAGAGLPTMVASNVNVGGAREVAATDYWMDVSHADTTTSTPTKTEALGRTKHWEIPTHEFGENLAANIGSERVRRLDYHNEGDVTAVSNQFRAEVIFGSDLIYFHEDTDSIVKCIHALMEMYGERALFLSPTPAMDVRRSLDSATDEMRKWAVDQGMSFRLVELSLCCTGYQCEKPKYGNECGDYILIEVSKEP
eukprot:CAMPEP_0178507902 /NCGR_PEP_ID=MMETSP0696-20121128/20464_1 /TAXON_ID=265572 /ORGANISM="Extubocellulus spinifer, Strain CCMP396" /LENGTH=439 /DNA_ID=CAMNT_0020137415 /DNA_START=302 /DNA_END=1621 /DNA_ORIENTATION=-